MNEKLVLRQDSCGVTLLTLNRPQALNCFTNELLNELLHAIEDCQSDAAVRVVALTGAGRAFCAGGDLDVLEKAGDAKEIGINLELANAVTTALYCIKKPTVAMVNGAAAGAGFNLALACDLIFASERAQFIQSFVKVGISPDCGGHWLLERAVGPYIAKELIYTARPVSAEEGMRLGFINRIYAPDELKAMTMEFAKSLAEGAPLALSNSKALINSAAEMTLSESLSAEADGQAALLLSNDCKEGIRAFKEKRTAIFRG